MVAMLTVGASMLLFNLRFLDGGVGLEGIASQGAEVEEGSICR